MLKGEVTEKGAKEKGSRPFQVGIPKFYRRVGTPMTLVRITLFIFNPQA
jgi:hypothetical protein